MAVTEGQLGGAGGMLDFITINARERGDTEHDTLGDS